MPVQEEEKRFLCGYIDNKFIMFDSLVFGSGSSPTVWGRFAAFLGRALASVFDPTELRPQVYVDDPLMVARGTATARSRRFTVALLWVAMLEFPVAWHKCEFGFHVRWIGARFSVGSEQVSVSIPEDKVSDLLERTNDLLALTTCSKRKLRSFCGSLSLSPALFAS